MPPEPDLFRALGALCEAPDPAHRRLAEVLGLPGYPDPADHTDLFVLNLVPCAAVYLGPEGMLGGESADRIAGFWRALHLTPPAEPDHLAALLGLYAGIAEGESGERDPARRLLWREARRTLLWEHLLSWVPAYTAAAAGTASPCYAGWARLLDAALRGEAACLPAAPVPRPRGDDGVDPPSPHHGLDELIRALLTPARSGLVLTRTDLSRAAQQTGLACRVGERAFMLRALVDQDAEAILGWLAAEADRWVRRHRAGEPLLGPTAGRWRIRAEASGHTLRCGQERAKEIVHAA